MKRQRGWLALLFGLALGPPVFADEEWDRLKADFEAAMGKWYENFPKAGGELDPAKLPPHPGEEYLPKMRAFAERNPAAEVAVPALTFIVLHGSTSVVDPTPHPVALDALKALGSTYVASPEIAAAAAQLQYARYSVGIELANECLRNIIARNTDRKTIAAAKFSLAVNEYDGPAMRDTTKEDEYAAGRRRGEVLFREIVKDFGDSDQAAKAKKYIFEIEHLQVGMKAPDIVGKDAAEKEIKLSQFAGQVVVLDFWGFW